MVGSIQDFVKNKSIIFVGNSVEIMKHKHAKFIESHDIVVRFGRAISATPEQEESLGSRCDIWITGQFRAPEWHKNRENFEKGKFKDTRILVNRCRGNFHLKNWNLEDRLPKGMKYEFMYSDEEIISIMKSFDKDILKCKDLRPSAGFISILWFVNKIKTYKSLNLIGFDFFAKTVPHRRTDKQGYESACDPHSWHLPVYMMAKSAHDKDLEQQYVSYLERSGKLKWHVLSDLKNKTLVYDGWMKGEKRIKTAPKKSKVSKI